MEGSALDAEGVSPHERFGHFPVREIQQPSEGWPRHLHSLGGFLLVQPFQMGQAQCFQLFNAVLDFLQFRKGVAPGLEIHHVG